MNSETDPELIQGTPFRACVGSHLQVMEDVCVGHPSVASLTLTAGGRFGANHRTTARQYWLFHHFTKFQRDNGHKSYDVNCVYWDDLGNDAKGKPLPTTCMVIGPFYLHDDESKAEADAVKAELEKYHLWPKTHLVVVGRGW